MVIRFQFAVLTKRNGEGNEVSHFTVCVWREEEEWAEGLSMHTTFFSASLWLSYSNSLCNAVYCGYHHALMH